MPAPIVKSHRLPPRLAEQPLRPPAVPGGQRPLLRRLVDGPTSSLTQGPPLSTGKPNRLMGCDRQTATALKRIRLEALPSPLSTTSRALGIALALTFFDVLSRPLVPLSVGRPPVARGARASSPSWASAATTCT
jgi:hypothetical protein